MLYSSIVSKEKNVFHYFPWNIGLYCEDFCAVSYRVLKSRSHIQSLKLISSTLEFIPMTVIFLNQLRIVSLDLCYVFTEYVFVSRFLLETYIPRFQHQYALDAFEGCIKVEVWFEVKRLQKTEKTGLHGRLDMTASFESPTASLLPQSNWHFFEKKKRPRFGSKVYSEEEKSERNKVIVVWLQKFCTSLPNWITIYCKKKTKEVLVCSTASPPPSPACVPKTYCACKRRSCKSIMHLKLYLFLSSI